MSLDRSQDHRLTQTTLYQIKLKGALEGQKGERFEGFFITLDEDGNTILTGTVIDQAALHGLIKKIRDLGMILVSIAQVQPHNTKPNRTKKGEK